MVAGKAARFLSAKVNFAVEIGHIRRKIQRRQAKKGRFYSPKLLSQEVYYRIDLVFYHRVLKCHVLLDLKIGKFDHADAGQMNVYLNYYRKNEMTELDNPPIGIILCADKEDSLVEYATIDMPHEVFVSKYLVALPSVETLKKLIDEDRAQILG